MPRESTLLKEAKVIETRSPKLLGGDINDVKNDVIKQNPGLKNLDFDITRGEGRGGSETFRKEEIRSPFMGRDTIQIRPASNGLSKKDLTRSVLGETLHLLPIRNPRFKQLKNEFTQSLNEQQMAFAQRRYESARQNEGETRPFWQWFEVSWSDALIRGFIAPDNNDEFRKNKAYSPENIEVLKKMQNFLKSGE